MTLRWASDAMAQYSAEYYGLGRDPFLIGDVNRVSMSHSMLSRIYNNATTGSPEIHRIRPQACLTRPETLTAPDGGNVQHQQPRCNKVGSSQKNLTH